MSDTYQAVYDAVRSRIINGNVGDVIERIARDAFDLGNARMLLQEQIGLVGNEMTRPSVLYRPTLIADGAKWWALYGEDLMTGVSGFGDTPHDAMADFDKAWWKGKTPDATRKEREDNAQFGVGA